MTEAELKAILMRRLRAELKGYVAFRHEDRRTSGVPDISITRNRLTSWWEVKYANPTLDGQELQELTMLRLAHTSVAYYLIYEERRNARRTLIVEPQHIGRWMHDWSYCTGEFNHQFVIEQVRKVHV